MALADEDDQLMIHVIRHTVDDVDKFVTNAINMKNDTDSFSRMERIAIGAAAPQEESKPSLVVLCFAKKRHVKRVEHLSRMMYGETTMIPHLFNRPVEQVTFAVYRTWERELVTPEAVVVCDLLVKDWDSYILQFEDNTPKIHAEMDRIGVHQVVHLGAIQNDDGSFRVLAMAFCKKSEYLKVRQYFIDGNFLAVFSNAFTLGIIPPVKAVAYEIRMDERNAGSN
eukprot:TRINITY_DN4504_c0_g3_i1.p1 TRINITY_DN4504_c0_g3~~TRINITY_DN4504_c0_g3_i1.p1  ORF type:complete len:246 (+),score=28.20 TRINITY_DN4504_c0_g3_i1:66-740(+)